MDTRTTRRRGSRLGLLAFVLLLGLAVVEVVGRLTPFGLVLPSRFVAAAWAVAQRPGDDEVARIAYLPLPYVMYGLKPAWERDTGVDGIVRTTNSLGFRGREIAVPKLAGRYRIVCLGGSTTYDDGVGDDETYPVQLERILRDELPGRDIEVVNAGVPSYTSAESLANLVFRCLELQPDALLVYDNINDYRVRTYGNFDSAYFHYRKVWNGTLDGWERGEGELAGGINPFIQHPPPTRNGDEASNVTRAGTWAFRRNLTCMAAVARAYGVEAWFVGFVLDRKHPYATPAVVAAVKEQNDVLREVAEAHGGRFIDLVAGYPDGDYFVDPVHNNAEGARVKARIIADALVEHLR